MVGAFFNTPNRSECQTTTFFRNGTTGTTIPTEIGLLTQLMSLDFSGTPWTGYIPSTLGYLTRLQYLRLDHNQRLFGTIPFCGQSLDLYPSNVTKSYTTHFLGFDGKSIDRNHSIVTQKFEATHCVGFFRKSIDGDYSVDIWKSDTTHCVGLVVQ